MATIAQILIWSGIVCFAVWIVSVSVFNPLSQFKGPALWKISRFPFTRALVGGQLPHRIQEMHQKYGSVVRVAPDELSFTDPAAWKDIYASNLPRAPQYRNRPPGKDAENFISASESSHARFRKVIAPAFAERCMDDYEKIIHGNVDSLMKKLRQLSEITDSDQSIDLLQWFNYITLDIIGDILWSSSFGCLESRRIPSWMQPINQFKLTMVRVALRYYYPLDLIVRIITPNAALAPLMEIWRNIEEALSRRLTVTKSLGPDIVSHIMNANKAASVSYMSRSEIEMNSLSFIIAGSESVTTVLTGVTNHLLRNPLILQKLTAEIRSNFKDETEMSNRALSKLPYLDAVIREGLRTCPTIPDGIRRITPQGGAFVAGYYLPEGITVSVSQWAAYHSSSNFHSPWTFQPERWLAPPSTPTTQSSTAGSPLGDKEYRAPNAFNPFSLGAHNCPGKSIAHMEMRLILARLLWNFEIEKPTDRTLPVWETQDIYWFWVKKPLYVRLRELRTLNPSEGLV